MSLRPATFAIAAGTRVCLLLSALSALPGCGAITVRDAPQNSTRQLPPSAPAIAKADHDTASTGLKLARLLRDQGRFEAASGVYGQLERRGDLKPLELLEYASVAAQVQSPQDNLALFGRARQALLAAGGATSPATTTALCDGLGRARLALGQNEAALGDFECALAATPDDVVALNGKGVLLDARGDHAQARVLLERAREIAPADFRILNNLALSWLASGDTAQAIRLLSQAPLTEWPTLRLNLAFAQILQGDQDDAHKTLTELMPEPLAQQALNEFIQRRERVRAGEPVAQELLEASRKLLPLRERDNHG